MRLSGFPFKLLFRRATESTDNDDDVVVMKMNIRGKIRTKVDLVSTKYSDRIGEELTADENLNWGKGWKIIAVEQHNI